MSPRGLRVGLDARPALVNREGIGRYTRELVRALLASEGDETLRLFGSTLAASRAAPSELGLPHPRARLVRWRVPAKAIARGLELTRLGVDDLLGGCDLFHHTQPNVLRVRRARQVLTVFDALFIEDARGRGRHGGPPPGWVEPETARRMTATLRAAAARADLILTGCRFVADDIVEALDVDPAKVRVTYLGCDHLNVMPRSTPARPYLLTVARVDPRKNHVAVLRAFEALVAEGRDLEWIIAGPRGWRSEEVEAAIQGSPAAARIHWRTEVSEHGLAELYAGAALFVWPSYAEGYGLPPLEAMRAGVPVIASNRTSLPEVLGEGALAVDPEDDGGLLAGCRLLLDDPVASAALVARGVARAAELTWARTARETRAAYAESG